MPDSDDFKIKGAAAERAEVTQDVSSLAEETSTSVNTASSSPQAEPKPVLEEGDELSPEEKKARSMTEQQSQEPDRSDDLQKYRWCKCFCDPVQYGRDYYFLHLDTQESRWDEPEEPYWVWDAEKQALDERGLQRPSDSAPATATDEADPEYYGYDPRIHGSYDPNAPYAQYHKQKREQENAAAQPPSIIQPGSDESYGSTANFNRFTGAYQTADKSMEQHDDHHKSGRQMGSFFDVDAAANAHGGRSLKEERRNQQLSKKQVKELAAKRREKKEKKRLDFWKS